MNPMLPSTGTLPATLAQSPALPPAETASAHVAALAKAAVEARYVMALNRPRDFDMVRQRLLAECRRPSFANGKSAYYRKPIGEGVEGLGIRFVEVALRCMTNVLVETTMIFEDQDREIHRVSVTDLEANITYPTDVMVSKLVERGRPSDDGSYISVRKNSKGRQVYTVRATEDDLLNKRGAHISKAIRTLGLRIIPGDLQDEAIETIKRIRTDQAAKDPAAERKRVADAFAEIGVRVSDLTEYLGHTLDVCAPHELVDLRAIYGSIRDGEATWAETLENKQSQREAKTDRRTEPTQVGPSQPAMTDEQFAAKKAAWQRAVQGGKSVNDLIATIESKAALTDEQKMEIASWAAVEYSQ